MQFSSKDVVVFDLDDTLYKEIDFVRSGFRAIANHFGLGPQAADNIFSVFSEGSNAMQFTIDKYGLNCDISALLKIYRDHFPEIQLEKGAQELLSSLRRSNANVGIISDGRSLTQRNKLKALGLDWIEDVIISEEIGESKPHDTGYQFFMRKYPGHNYFYIGDNLEKDFICPNKLGWTTIGIKDDGRNIHRPTNLPEDHQPCIMIDGFGEITDGNFRRQES